MAESKRERPRAAGDRIRAVSASPRVTGMAKVLQGFKDFIARGNAIELAVGVVVGAAFTAVVAALQDAFISPVIGWIFGKPNLEGVWDIGPYTWRTPDPGEDPIAPIQVGVILNALLQFLITAAAIYFLIVLPLNALAARRKKGEEDEPAAPAEDVLLLQEIRDLLAQRLTPAIANDTTPSAGATPTVPPVVPPTAPGTPPEPPSNPPGA
ncbi:large conductance mechanosensitive channel protein MscL [Cellulomonas wangsupingiae]|uniref:Large-conductance mechanosensitive channel n=1 Tax=Cellulomonas wangsupingiae TaxID=2968085 RepID=A0ABY5K836_9CELL|nr:large conductance mechanosensitive channel protein MscL [Cellulomonas wangsupingiae]MCC2334288.1 large conductance mechanosensitive channel protein MscL [Cellulomonas wangsupingiae]MCM0641287.1 large conductance mechanosensitive channel protein MscL [Cellulomonas wangsupingiae]UUI65964.1 large conductance mechanosensitive channel protein MscL [Cellulomonas wangsupingiae]